MPGRMILEKTVYQRREKLLVAAPELFELGTLSDVSNDYSFIRRLNIIMARRRADMEKNIPATLADAISAKGFVEKHAELAVFGTWLSMAVQARNHDPGRSQISRGS